MKKNIIILLLLLTAFAEPVQCGYAQFAINWNVPDPNAYILCGFVSYENIKLKQVNVNNSGVETNVDGYYELSGYSKNNTYNVNYTRYGFIDNNSEVNNTINQTPYWHNVSLNANILEPLGVRTSNDSILPAPLFIYSLFAILIIYWRSKKNV